MTDPNQPIEPEVTADAANPEAEEQVVEAEVVDEAAADAAPESATPADGAAPAPGDGEAAGDAEVHPDTARADQLQDDYLRLQAEYVNYKRRVDRDLPVHKERAVHDLLESLLPVLDEIHLAEQHGDLPEGSPFRAIADKLEQVLAKQGLERVGVKGEAFDPNVHEALMHGAWDASDTELPSDATATTVVTVLQPGYRAGERVLRAARVAVADPQ
ncbi:GrpE protein HSP-70 cofactor [Janibacter hoylei PVAS-1]|uniref:Protein GrpE n=1 Tax=Janibacter hoylei PVAS-1 TaxID=1210046 RepID=K1EA99_9MICO|nr:nucleotide exchange factor GrpE [Janibacter hoylei]EKA62322.1 GrpE protein HSP-70 cofactor [Janibacter hoylei PVAS-1]